MRHQESLNMMEAGRYYKSGELARLFCPSQSTTGERIVSDLLNQEAIEANPDAKGWEFKKREA